MLIRIAGIEPESIVDGPGYRFAVFVQGCPHGCPGCHNPKTHDFEGGEAVDTDDIIAQLGKNPLVRGLTLSGGEPMLKAQALLEVAKAAKARGMNVWCYTGYTYEQLMETGDPDQTALLDQIDVLVDGPYIAARRSLDLAFRGSGNQRLIDMNKTRETGALAFYDPEAW
ncbi:MAG: anaerobic ribonucleoside-triphosphate reductase activating protein [Clostridia bacterium]|nr:anaerobic ribonucleoside-triphosphate reductase activating protein [Clostridia bacterium]